MSPPSLATAGRTRVSISSLIVATVSASAGSKNSPASVVSPLVPAATIGAPDMKCSMITPRIAGLSCGHSAADLVTVMKSEPRNTPLTPWMSNSRSASGDWAASALSRISSVPEGSTVRPGRNFKVAGLGVTSVWMNIDSSGRHMSARSIHRNRWSFEPATSMRLRQRVEILVAQMPRHHRDRNRIIARRLSEARHQRSRSFLAGSSRQHQDRDVLVFVDQLEDLLGGIAVADHALGRNTGHAVGARCEFVELLVRSLIGFRLHDVGDAEPLLMTIMRLDHQQHDDARACARSAAARVIDRAVAFRRLVDHDQELGLVPGLVAAALQAHRMSPEFPNLAVANVMLTWRPGRGQAALVPDDGTSVRGQRRMK